MVPSRHHSCRTSHLCTYVNILSITFVKPLLCRVCVAMKLACGYSEERNRLRLQAREQRNQETSQAKKHHADNVPLFGELYRPDKREDALSNKIRMLLGSYEDGNSSNPPTAEPLLIPFHGNFSRQVQPLPHSQSASTSNSISSQSTSTAISDHYGNGSILPKTELNQLPTQQQTISDLRDRSQAVAEAPSFLPTKECENIGNNAIHHKDRLILQHTQESTDSRSAMEISLCPINQSPKEGPLPRSSKSNPLLQQTFASLLSSKQPSSIMTQKPTAYVRPLDGQDQTVNESPDLKPPPEPIEPLQDSTMDHVKSEMLLHYLETKTDGAICVEDILRELIHPWPPLLTPIHTMFKEEPQSPPTPKEVKDVSACPGQKISVCTAENPPVLVVQSSSLKGESASSSESESCSRSESDSESVTADPQAPAGGSTTEVGAPAVTHGNWQLGNWIRSSQQSSSSKYQGGARVSDSFQDTLQPSCSESVVASKESQLSPHSGNKSNPKYCAERSGQSREATLEPPLADMSVLSSQVPIGKAVCSSKSAAAVSVKSVEIAPAKGDLPFTDRPKVKTEISHHRKSSNTDRSKDLNKKRTDQVSPHCPTCVVRFPDTCSCFIKSEPSPGRLGKARRKENATGAPLKDPCSLGHKDRKKGRHEKKEAQSSSRPPFSLVVKIDLSLLSRPPCASRVAEEKPLCTERTGAGHDVGSVKRHRHGSRKSSAETVDINVKAKKRKLETKKPTPAVKQESSCGATEGQEPKKLKKSHMTPSAVKKESKHVKRRSEETKEALEPRKKKSGTQDQTQKQSSKKTSGTCRPLLRFEDRLHSVKHYIKEAKRLKHKADSESDKLSKGFNYLDAAMYFVESGIAMKKDPQISLSSHTMFAETVELLKFVLKLKSSCDLSPSEKDFIALCLRCQSLLQMAMFQHKQRTAQNYSKTLVDHFSTSAHSTQDPSATLRGTNTPSPLPSAPSPAPSTGFTQSGSGPAFAVSIPQTIGQMTVAYVNITALCLSAHDMWEQSEELAKKGSGLLSELDSAVGPLTLTSSVSSMVRYTRQGVAWLRLDNNNNKRVK
ncbi:AF4/FMR2 family member 1 [Synchiropus picturatus]